MNWLRRVPFWVLLFLMALGVYFLWEGLREHDAPFSRFALAQVFSRGLDRLCTTVIVQELHLRALHVETIPPQGEGVWQVQAIFANRDSLQSFAEGMENFFTLLPYMGFRGERRVEGEDETYTLFFGEHPFFFLRLKVKPRFQVAIVIDDLGYDLRLAEKFLALPVKLNVAVLPNLPHTQDVVRMAKAKEKEILIHFPMEAFNGKENTKEGLLLRVGMSSEKVKELLERVCGEIPGARGLNNHKGSRVTSTPELMKVFFGHLKEHDLYFLDSLTTSKSVAFQIAQENGIRAFRRDVFLDTYPAVEYVKNQLRTTIQVAKKKGYAIAIGHPRESTYRALSDFLSSFSDPDVEFVFLSEIQKKESM